MLLIWHFSWSIYLIIFSLIFASLIPTLALLTLRLTQSGFQYVHEMLKMLPEMPEPILLTQIFAKLTALGRIHNVSTGVEPS
jgi:putative transposase